MLRLLANALKMLCRLRGIAAIIVDDFAARPGRNHFVCFRTQADILRQILCSAFAGFCGKQPLADFQATWHLGEGNIYIQDTTIPSMAYCL